MQPVPWRCAPPTQEEGAACEDVRAAWPAEGRFSNHQWRGHSQLPAVDEVVSQNLQPGPRTAGALVANQLQKADEKHLPVFSTSLSIFPQPCIFWGMTAKLSPAWFPLKKT